MANKEVRLTIPESLYKKLKEVYSEEGYVTANSFVVDLIRERLNLEKPKKKKRSKRKKDFMDYFSKKK